MNTPLPQRLLAHQRTGDGQYLTGEWDRSEARYLRELYGLAFGLLGGAEAESSGEARTVRVLQYGCGAGAVFRGLQDYLGHLFDFRFIGIDPDWRALGFVQAKFPGAETHAADLDEFCRLAEAGELGADLAIGVMACYALDETNVGRLVGAFCRTAPLVVLADQVDNVNGDDGALLRLVDSSGRDYEAHCPAFARHFASAGFGTVETWPTGEPAKSLSGLLAASRAPLDLGAMASPGRDLAMGKDRLKASGPLFGETLARYLAGHRLTAMDVGAAGGIHPLWAPFGDYLTVDAFEPDAGACERAAATSAEFIRWHPLALGGVTGTQPFYLLKAPTGSSFYPPNDDVQKFLNTSDYRAVDKVLEMETWTIPDFLESRNCAVPNLIKLDTQGSELDILRTIRDDQWQEVYAIECEVEFIEVYKQQPLFGELVDYLTSKGMIIFDLRTAREYCCVNDDFQYYMKTHLNYEVGTADISARLYAGDVLLFRDFCDGPLHSRDFVLKMIAVLLIYSYFDYALFLADRALGEGLLTGEEHAVLFQDIVRAAPRPERWQRADETGAAARAAMGPADWDGHIYKAFWQTRAWPNQ